MCIGLLREIKQSICETLFLKIHTQQYFINNTKNIKCHQSYPIKVSHSRLGAESWFYHFKTHYEPTCADWCFCAIFKWFYFVKLLNALGCVIALYGTFVLLYFCRALGSERGLHNSNLITHLIIYCCC